MKFRVATGKSRITVRTRATGVFAKLAHDLELVTTEIEGEVEGEEGAWRATLSVLPASLRVAGTLSKQGITLDPQGVSSGDKAQIEKKIREDVLGVHPIAVDVRGSADRAEATVRVGGRSQTVSCSLMIEKSPDTGVTERTASGEVALSLKALGIAEVKGPLGAFKVSDAVEVVFRIVVTA